MTPWLSSKYAPVAVFEVGSGGEVALDRLRDELGDGVTVEEDMLVFALQEGEIIVPTWSTYHQFKLVLLLDFCETHHAGFSCSCFRISLARYFY